MKEYVLVFTSSEIIIHHLQKLLNEIKIPSLIKDAGESGRLAGFGTQYNSVELYVFNTDKEKAIKVIKDFEKLEKNN